MKITITGSIVTLEKSNPKERYATESALFYALRNALKRQGLDVIKRNPARDGHLTSAPYYIRERKGDWAIHDGSYALRMAHADFNKNGVVVFGLHGLASDALRRCFGVSTELDKRAREAKPPVLTEFAKQYAIRALWSTHDESTPSGGEPMGKNYTLADLHDETVAEFNADCEKFQQENAKLLAKTGARVSCNATDFWLTRNHHGAGFWDRGYPQKIGDALTKAAHAFGEVNLYVGDDKKIYS